MGVLVITRRGFSVGAAGAVEIPADDVALIDVIADFSRASHFYYFWEVEPSDGSAGGRSELDRVVIRTSRH